MQSRSSSVADIDSVSVRNGDESWASIFELVTDCPLLCSGVASDEVSMTSANMRPHRPGSELEDLAVVGYRTVQVLYGQARPSAPRTRNRNCGSRT